jgi:hypothetical protein
MEYDKGTTQGDYARTAADVAPCLIPSPARTPAASNYKVTINLIHTLLVDAGISAQKKQLIETWMVRQGASTL